MGRMGPVAGMVRHDGYVLPFFADGAEGVSYGAAGVLVDFDRDDWRPDTEVVGWHAGCACGWRGPDWTRSTAGEPAPRWPVTWWGTVNTSERKLRSDSALLDRDADQAVIEAWLEHVRPWQALEEATELAAEHADVGRKLDAAVSIARSGGATWADIGRAVGITRQSARERWATKLGEGTGEERGG